MKKLILLMLGGVMLATSAVAKEAQTQIVAKPEQTALSQSFNKKTDAVLANSTLWGVNGLSVEIYITAFNTDTYETFYLTVPPNNGSANVSIPTGIYDIHVSTNNVFANIYLSDDDDSYSVYNVYFHTFSNTTINYGYSTVVSVSN